MIEQTAIVTDVSREFARVRVYRESSCGSCHAQKACGTQALSKVLGQKFSEMTVLNPINAKIGDEVNIGLRESVLLKSAFLVYVFPLAMLFLGAVSVHMFNLKFNLGFNSDLDQLFVVLGGLAGFIFAFVRIKKIMRSRVYDERYQPVILEHVAGIKTSVNQDSQPVHFVKG